MKFSETDHIGCQPESLHHIESLLCLSPANVLLISWILAFPQCGILVVDAVAILVVLIGEARLDVARFIDISSGELKGLAAMTGGS